MASHDTEGDLPIDSIWLFHSLECWTEKAQIITLLEVIYDAQYTIFGLIRVFKFKGQQEDWDS